MVNGSSRIAGVDATLPPLVVAVIVIGALTGPRVAAAGEVYDWGIVHCESDFPLEAADSLRDHLTLLHKTLAQDTGLEFGTEPLEIRLFSDRRQYIRQVSPIVSDAKRQRGVYVIRDGRVAVYSFQQRDLAMTLRHESVHAWLHAAMPYVPLWLDEGLASYYEIDMARQSILEHPYASRVRWSVRLGWRPKLRTLEAIERSADMALGDYRHAWAWVHFLMNESDESRAVLTGYLQNIAADQPPERLSEKLARELPDAEPRLVRYFAGR